MNLDLDGILARDGIAEMEKMTGMHWSKMQDAGLGLAMLGHHMTVNRQKEAALRLLGDSHYGTTLAKYVAIIESIGFRKVLELPFKVDRYEHGDTFLVYWWDAGVLLCFDTYGGEKSVNGGHFYYNWKVKPEHAGEQYRVTSSGGWNAPDHVKTPPYEVWRKSEEGDAEAMATTDAYRAAMVEHGVWAGSHDCRDAIRHKIDKLQGVGSFVTPWQYDPRPWMCHYGDTKESGDFNRYDVIRQERIAMLPQHVREAMGVTDTHRPTPASPR